MNCPVECPNVKRVIELELEKQDLKAHNEELTNKIREMLTKESGEKDG